MGNLPDESDENNFDSSDVQPEKYWNEAQWEKHLLANEQLMDKYQKVWEEDPERLWEDPTDLYIKVHHGIDLGKDFKPEKNFQESREEKEEEEDFGSSSPSNHASTCQHPIMDELDNIPPYRLSMEFAVNLRENPEHKEGSDLWQKFLLHATRISADIAGGHGLGYEEDNLCGNIVKNRWALEHTKHAKLCLNSLLKKGINGQSCQYMKQLNQIEEELEKRIAELQSKVWWE